MYHTDALNVIAGLTTEEYINLAILKLTPYVNVEIRLIIRLYVANFFSILAIYSLYFSLKSICIFSTLTWSVVTFSMLSILIVACKLKSLGLLIKCINSYFFRANFALCVLDYSLYSL